MVKNNGLYVLFLHELADMYNAETQIVEALPKLIKAASVPELKEAFTVHLKETKHQVERLNKIFKILGEPIKTVTCKGVKGLIEEAGELLKSNLHAPTLDAGIIAAAQKVEHYEIASYGTLRSFANQLSLSGEIIDLLQENLDEEGAADKKLTKIAEGSFFSEGVNQEAVGAGSSHRSKK